MEWTLQALIDREQIRETIMAWSRAVDTNDWDLLDLVYTDDLDSDFSVLGLPKTPVAKLKEMLMQSEKYFDVMQHIISNITFHEQTADSARTTVMVTSWTRPIGGEPFQVHGWYHDTLRKTPDGWRICARRFEQIMNT